MSLFSDGHTIKKLLFRIKKNETNRRVGPLSLSKERDGLMTEDDKQPLQPDLMAQLDEVRQALGDSSDLVIRQLKAGQDGKTDVAFIYLDGMVNPTIVYYLIQSFLVRSDRVDLNMTTNQTSDAGAWIQQLGIAAGDVQPLKRRDDLLHAVLCGKTVLVIDGHDEAHAVCTNGWEHRTVSEPTSQTVIKGPQEAFTETIRVNTALVRKRIKHPDLRIESKELGLLTKTSVSVIYIQGIVDEGVLAELHSRLESIKIDGVLESNYVEEFIQDSTFGFFPTVNNTERPDVVAAALLEGRVAIIIDGSPHVLIVPSLFTEFMQSAEDYYQRYDFGFSRMLRFVSFVITLLTPSIYIALTTFHQEMIPTQMLISLAAQREGVPFPAFVEAVMMEITFRLLYEAGIRMPRAVGTAISIVGALVLGEAAVEADLVSPVMVIIVSITAITSMIFPNPEVGISIRLLRFVFMGLAASFGFYGIFIGTVILVMHMCHLESFGKPYMSPLAPFRLPDQKDTLVRAPWWMMYTRPSLLHTNVYREPPDESTEKRGGSDSSSS